MPSVSELQRSYWLDSLAGLGVSLVTPSNADLEFNFYKNFGGGSGSLSDMKRSYFLKASGLSTSTLTTKDLETNVMGSSDPTTQYASGNKVRVNYAFNPTFALNTGSHVAGGAGSVGGSLSVDSTKGSQGTTCIKALSGTNGLSGITGGSTRPQQYMNVSPNNPYTISMDVWTPLVKTVALQIQHGLGATYNGNIGADTTISPSVSTWTRLAALNKTVPGGSDGLRYFCNINSGAAGEELSIDAVLVELGATMGSYFDGSMPNCYWEGTAHASRSFKVR